MPKYLLATHRVEGEERPPMSDEEMQAFMGRVQALESDMRSTGSWVFGGALHTPDTATVVRSQNGETLTTDGPFAESKEHIAGFYIVEAEDLDAALEWGSRTSAAIERPIEVRPFSAISGE